MPVQPSQTDTVYHWYLSPIGKLLLTGFEDALTGICFPSQATTPSTIWREDKKPFKDTCTQLDMYFDRKLTTFDLPLAPKGTQFQKRVWEELCDIPYGQTKSYKYIADKIGNSKAVRAVGSANGRNPIPIIIPCHRVIGSDGSLTCFGGGLPVKTYLLNLENAEQMALAF